MSRVQTRPEWQQLVHNGVTYSVGFQQTGAGGTFTLVQLWNPVGSGVRLLVSYAAMVPGATSQLIMGTDPVQAASPIGGQTAIPLLAGTTIPAKGLVTVAQPAAAPTSQLSIRRTLALGNTKDEFPGPGPGLICELPEGQGFDLMTVTANITTAFTIWWAEVPTGSYA